MTQADRREFDSFFHGNELQISDIELITNSFRCEKLFEYLHGQLPEGKETDIVTYMVFAYTLGKYGKD